MIIQYLHNHTHKFIYFDILFYHINIGKDKPLLQFSFAFPSIRQAYARVCLFIFHFYIVRLLIFVCFASFFAFSTFGLFLSKNNIGFCNSGFQFSKIWILNIKSYFNLSLSISTAFLRQYPTSNQIFSLFNPSFTLNIFILPMNLRCFVEIQKISSQKKHLICTGNGIRYRKN